MAVAALVLGIISIVTCWIWYIGPVVGIIGIVLGALGRRDPEKAGMATAGLACSIIGVVLSVIGYIACVGCAASLGIPLEYL